MENINAKIEQYKADQKRLREEQTKLEKELVRQKSAVELRHGDYDATGHLYLEQTSFITGHGDILATNAGSWPDLGFDDSCGSFPVEDVIGNIWDDLKRNSEDLNRFEAKGNALNRNVNVTLQKECPEILLQVSNNGEQKGIGVLFNLKDMSEFCQKLNQVIAFGKREENK